MNIERGDLIKTGSDWRLQYGDDETKAKRALGPIVDPKLVPFLEHYLRTTRRLVPGAEAHDYLWPASRRQVMADITIYGTVIKHSRELLGVAITPHFFRTIAATFLAARSSEDALHARPLLADRDMRTTAEHHIRASQREASRNGHPAQESRYLTQVHRPCAPGVTRWQDDFPVAYSGPSLGARIRSRIPELLPGNPDNDRSLQISMTIMS